MNGKLIYREQVSSTRTELLFLFLTFLFFLLLIWRIHVASFDLLAGTFLLFFCFFLFYSVNFRRLIIRLTSESLTLSFGVFAWTIPLDNIEQCRLDDISPVMRMGGAGIHFMLINKRYRASFNFLEYDRVVLSFKRKIGWVGDISFSTRHPDDVIHHIQVARSAKMAT